MSFFLYLYSFFSFISSFFKFCLESTLIFLYVLTPISKYHRLTFLTPPPTTTKSLQSCPTLCDPIDGSPPGSPVPGILQARTLEWVAISFSNAGKWKVKVKSLSGVQPLATPWTAAFQAPLSMGFSRQEYWSGVPLTPTGAPLICLYTVYTQFKVDFLKMLFESHYSLHRTLFNNSVLSLV